MTQPESVSIDELEQVAGSVTAQKPNLSELKLESDDVPEEFKGKAVTEVLARAEQLKKALQLSEETRLSLAQALEGRSKDTVQPPPPPVEEEPFLTDEQIQEIFQEDALKAVRIMNDQAIRRAQKHVEARLAPILSGSQSSAEQNARQKYAAEFSLFGDQIEATAKGLPNPAVLANSSAWDDLISYIRGRPGNFDRLMAHHEQQKAGQNQQTAQQTQSEASGFTARSSVAAPVAQSAGELDETQKEIARTLGMDYADYVRWSKVG